MSKSNVFFLLCWAFVAGFGYGKYDTERKLRKEANHKIVTALKLERE